MRRLPIDQVEPGSQLACGVLNPTQPTSTALERDQEVNARVLAGLRKNGVRALWIQDAVDLDLELHLNEGRQLAERKLCAELLQVLLRSNRLAGESAPALNRQTTLAFIQTLMDSPRIYCPADLVSDPQGQILLHSVQVCVLSTLIGLTLPELSQESPVTPEALLPLVMGALLHDIGKLSLPDRIRFRDPWELSRRDLEQLERHPLLGRDLLQDTYGRIIADCALYHHRNRDESGYPPRQPEEPLEDEPHRFARFVAIAEAFETLVGGNGYNHLEALEELNCARRHHFDPLALQALNHVVPPFALGSSVRLGGGYEAVVARFSPERPFRPVLVLTHAANGTPLKPEQYKQIDLGEHPQQQITHCDGRKIHHLVPDDPQVRWEDLS